MSKISEHQNHRSHSQPFARLAFYGFLAIALVFLLVEHGAHLLSSWWLLLILACPLMHFGMHGGHSHGGHDEARKSVDDPGQTSGSSESSPPHRH